MTPHPSESHPISLLPPCVERWVRAFFSCLHVPCKTVNLVGGDTCDAPESCVRRVSCGQADTLSRARTRLGTCVAPAAERCTVRERSTRKTAVAARQPCSARLRVTVPSSRAPLGVAWTSNQAGRQARRRHRLSLCSGHCSGGNAGLTCSMPSRGNMAMSLADSHLFSTWSRCDDGNPRPCSSGCALARARGPVTMGSRPQMSLHAPRGP